MLQVSRSAYYAYQQSSLTARQLEDHRLRALVRNIFHRHKRRYGARRIVEELAHQGETCGRHRVARLMKEMELKAIQPRSFQPKTTDSRHGLGYSPNLLLEAPAPQGVNQIWVADISYVPLVAGDFLYLALLMDLFSRYIVGWQLLNHMREELVLAALRLAIASRQPSPGLIHHSDRGGQYGSRQYRAMLTRAQMRQSMSRAENVYDNAFMESCFGTIKTELELKAMENPAIARKEIDQYIRYYNHQRLHSSLGYQTPSAYEALHCSGV